MQHASWDPAVYGRYADERLRPALDLLARVPPAASIGDDGAPVFDLGCGTGSVTRLLAERFPGRRVVGVDRSAAMLDEARAAAGAGSEPEWVEADLATWSPPEPAGLLFSNAALHWLPEHEELLVRWVDALVPGGALAVQVPRSWGLPSHRVLREVLAEGESGVPFGPEALRAALARPPVREPEAYVELLVPRTIALDVWETTYHPLLEGEDAVLRWVEGTALRPVLGALREGERERFLARYRARLAAAYPRRADGLTVYPFPRLFLVAQR